MHAIVMRPQRLRVEGFPYMRKRAFGALMATWIAVLSSQKMLSSSHDETILAAGGVDLSNFMPNRTRSQGALRIGRL